MKHTSYNWKEKRQRTAFLALEDGTILRGYSVGAPTNQLGEVVFNTGMTGYQEILTDPSYHGQIVAMTYTEIGNTGINPDDPESRRPFANGFLVQELTEPSNWRSTQSLRDYLTANGIPCLAGIDTRALTQRLRVRGTLKGLIVADPGITPEQAVEKARDWSGLDNQDYAAKVTCDTPYEWDPDDTISTSWGMPDCLPDPDLRIVALDYGIKWNILRNLRAQGMAVTVMPAGTDAQTILAAKPDGVFLSNGPGDPAGIPYAPAVIRDLLGNVPIMGICLGHQLLGTAFGGQTQRLKFGHHGINHPVMDLATRKVEITSQNHNFVLDPDTIDTATVEITHINLNDNTVEGLRHKTEPAFCVQYHPEAGPGPHDPAYLFRRFRALITNEPESQTH